MSVQCYFTRVNRKERWRARVRGSKSLHLGVFDTEDEARAAVKAFYENRKVQPLHPTQRLAIQLIGEENWRLLQKHGLAVRKA